MLKCNIFAQTPKVMKKATTLSALSVALGSIIMLSSSVAHANSTDNGVSLNLLANVDHAPTEHSDAPMPKLEMDDNKLKFRTYGEFGIGLYTSTGGPHAYEYDNGIYIEGGVEFTYGNWYGLVYAEGNPVQVQDGEAYVPDHSYGGFEGGVNRLYLGYKFDNGTKLEAGLFNDSSLDDVEFWNEFTPDFGYASPNTRDVFGVIKMENLTGPLKWSVTAASEGNFDEDDALLHFGKYDRYSDKFSYPTALVNGYVIYEWQKDYGLLLGSELTDGTGQYYTAGVLLNYFGARAWHHTGRGGKDNLDLLGKESGYIFSAKYDPWHNFWLSITYTHYRRDFDNMQGSADGKFGLYDHTVTSYVNGGIWWEYEAFGNTMVTAFDLKLMTGQSENITRENKIYLMQIFYW